MSESTSSANAAADRHVLAEETIGPARQYAEAFLNAAENQDRGQVDSLVDELEEIGRDVWDANPRFADVLGSARVSASEKDRILGELFEGRASDLVVRFLRVLNRHGRLGLFPALVRETRRLWDKRQNRVPVSIRSATPLSEAQQDGLRERLSGLAGGTPILRVTTDPSLIGGLVIQIGDYRYDASVKNRLEQLRQRLIEGKTHEIQSRRDQFSHPA